MYLLKIEKYTNNSKRKRPLLIWSAKCFCFFLFGRSVEIFFGYTRGKTQLNNTRNFPFNRHHRRRRNIHIRIDILEGIRIIMTSELLFFKFWPKYGLNKSFSFRILFYRTWSHTFTQTRNLHVYYWNDEFIVVNLKR